ncbi:3-hydroxyacyl-CoA dehydrogenase family protein [Aeribacillus pallidus]|nr:3-hydroxyacyl-CoA dehydrogenase family protein [Aeribacillus pallidus]
MKTKSFTVKVAGKGSLADSIIAQLRETGHQLEDQSAVHSNFDIVIETTNLDIDQKKKLLVEIEKTLPKETVILSTCLGVTATETASWLQHPERLVGFAAFFPWEDCELVELAPALQTEKENVEKAKQFFEEVGKEVEVVEDGVGLVFPRILSLIINEAAFALTEGVASAEDIDKAMMKGTNYPMGPLRWADHIGIDDVYAVLAGLFKETGEDRYRPAPFIKKMVYAKWFGKKTGRGFYQYD